LRKENYEIAVFNKKGGDKRSGFYLNFWDTVANDRYTDMVTTIEYLKGQLPKS